MKKSLLVLSCCALALGAGTASAEGLYGSAAIGLSSVSDLTFSGSNDDGSRWSTDSSFDTGVAVNAAVGYSFDNPSMRAELEFGFHSNDFDKLEETGYSETARDGSLNVFKMFLNGYYDFRSKSAFTPYIGAGVGFVQVDVDDLKIGDDPDNHSFDDNVFGYQIILGVSYAFNRSVAMDISYRYIGTTDPTFEEYGREVDFEFSGHNFMVGLRVNF